MMLGESIICLQLIAMCDFQVKFTTPSLQTFLLLSQAPIKFIHQHLSLHPNSTTSLSTSYSYRPSSTLMVRCIKCDGIHHRSGTVSAESSIKIRAISRLTAINVTDPTAELQRGIGGQSSEDSAIATHQAPRKPDGLVQ